MDIAYIIFMKLHYSPKENFGDSLNPVLWNWIYVNLCEVEPEWDVYGVGTLLKRDNDSKKSNNKLIMGSGYGYGKPVKLNSNWHIGFVRGPMSSSKLKISPEFGIGDPAPLLLLHPNFKIFSTSKRCGNLILPHHRSEELIDWSHISELTGFRYCSPNQNPRDVISQIASAELVLTESLHGAIFAEFLNIPWVPFVSTKHINSFKWQDWCQSLQIQYYPKYCPVTLQGKEVKFLQLVKNLPKKLIGKCGIIKRYTLTPIRKTKIEEYQKIAQFFIEIAQQPITSTSKIKLREEQIEKMHNRLSWGQKFGLALNSDIF
jgi:succinoglycan biosynthesis protein ExoV